MGPLPLVTPEKPKDQLGGLFTVQIPWVDSHPEILTKYVQYEAWVASFCLVPLELPCAEHWGISRVAQQHYSLTPEHHHPENKPVSIAVTAHPRPNHYVWTYLLWAFL